MLNTEQKIHKAALYFLANKDCDVIKDITYMDIMNIHEDTKNLLLVVWLHKYNINKINKVISTDSLSSKLLEACLYKIDTEVNYVPA